MSSNEFVIVPRGPFSLARAADIVAHFPPLRHQPRTSDGSVRLGFVADRTFEPLAVTVQTADYLGVLRVTVHGLEGATAGIAEVRRQVSRILALDVDGRDYPDLVRRDPALAPMMERFEGLRPVSFTSPYECACWAVVSQRISKEQAARVVGAIVEAHGPKVDGIGVFPPPLALLAIESVPGLSSVKLERLHAIARAALDGQLDADTLRALPEAEALRRLQDLPGIGAFWSSGVWLRACGVHDRFPDEPLSIAALDRLHEGRSTEEPTELYRPFGMWIAFMLRVATRRSSERPVARRAPSTTRGSLRAARARA